MTIIGYARVSTDGQTLDAQQAALKLAGAERTFAEKVSYRLRLIDSSDFWDSRFESKQLGCVVMIRSEGARS